MTETYQEKVKRFLDFNRGMIASAVAKNNLEEQGVNAKILLCSIIDSLAKSRYPQISGNGERFKRTIQTSANWPDCERISLLHLKRAIEVATNGGMGFARLSEWVDTMVQRDFEKDNLILSGQIAIDKDPEFCDFFELWPKDNKNDPIKLGSIAWEKLTHKNLFWQYRNTLMHEYRIPGRAVELNVITSEPFYQKVSQFDDYCSDIAITFSNRWELLYPTNFFKTVAENILKEVAQYHLSEGTSPFNAYSDGTFWIPDFNENF